MPVLKSRWGDWQLESVHAWSDRALEMRAESIQLIDRGTKSRHVERHAVRYVVAEFLRHYAEPPLELADIDAKSS